MCRRALPGRFRPGIPTLRNSERCGLPQASWNTICIFWTPSGRAKQKLSNWCAGSFRAQVRARLDTAQVAGDQMNAAFAFLEQALGESFRKWLFFATELTANPYTSWYIQNFGCDACFRHNKALFVR